MQVLFLVPGNLFLKTLIRYQHTSSPNVLQDGVALPHTALALPYGGDVCSPAQQIFITLVILSIMRHFSNVLLCIQSLSTLCVRKDLFIWYIL